MVEINFKGLSLNIIKLEMGFLFILMMKIFFEKRKIITLVKKI